MRRAVTSIWLVAVLVLVNACSSRDDGHPDRGLPPSLSADQSLQVAEVQLALLGMNTDARQKLCAHVLHALSPGLALDDYVMTYNAEHGLHTTEFGWRYELSATC